MVSRSLGKPSKNKLRIFYIDYSHYANIIGSFGDQDLIKGMT
jgi:hypothetical protein